MIAPSSRKHIAAISALALFGLVIPLKADTDLPLDNPGFEDGMEGWSAWNDRGMSQVAPDAAHSGKMGLRVTVTDQSGDGANIVNRQFPATPGKTYDLKCWIRTVSGSGGAVYIKFFDANNQELPGDHAVSDSSTWTQLEVKAVAPPNTAQVGVWIHTGNHYLTTTDYDDFTLTELDSASAAGTGGTNAPPAPQ
jgi:hypothetical protein